MSIRRSPEAFWAVALLTVVATAAVAADGPNAASAERARIARERAEVESRAKDAEAACAREFAVSACLRQARAERRAAVQQLDRQRALLDEAQRKQRAADRLSRIRERQEAAARNDAKPKVEVRTRGEPAPVSERPASEVAAVEAAQAQRAERAVAAASAADAKAVQRTQATAQRELKARAHRDAVEARNKDRGAKKPPAAPLPVPATPASAPR
jgi:colicin import membrane protein